MADHGGQAPQQPAAPAPGWYRDGSGPAGRWWDGTQWGPQTRPLSGPAATPPQAPPGPPVRWAWALALTPAAWAGAAALVAAGTGISFGSGISWTALPALVFAMFAASADTRALRQAGERAPGLLPWLVLIGPWAYLLARAARRRGLPGPRWSLPVTGAVSWLAAIAALAAAAAVAAPGLQLDRAALQADIEKGIRTQQGVAVTADCPQDPPMNPGSVFQCTATAADRSVAIVTVTVQDDIVWKVTG